MPDFTFDPNKSPEDNIAAFLVHLESLDKEMADILRKRVSSMVPYPLEPSVRATKRAQFSTAVRQDIDPKQA